MIAMLRLILPVNPLGGLANPLGGLVYLPIRRYTGMSTHLETCEVIKDCKQRIRPSRSIMLRLILPANPLGGLANPLGGLVYLPIRRYTGMSTH